MANEFRIKKGLIVNETDLYVSGSKLGIGTDTPSQTLTVAGNISGSGNLNVSKIGAGAANEGSLGYFLSNVNNAGSFPVGGDPNTAGLKIENDNTTAGSYASVFLRSYTGDAHLYASTTGTSNAVNFGIWLDNTVGGAADTRFFIEGQTGNVGIGTTSPSTKLEVNGTITGNGSGLTNLNASNLSTGTVNDARLPGTISSDITGNAATATKWATARTLTIGDTGKSVDGSGNVSWSRTEIGITKTNIDALNIDADTIDSLNSTQFLRSDANDSTSGNLTINGVATVNNDLVVNESGRAILVKGTGTADATDSMYIEFQLSNGTQVGYIGDPTSGATRIDLLSSVGDLSLVAASSDINLNASSGTVNVNTGLSGTTATFTGDLTVGGKVTAEEFHTEFVSASIIYQSGSTKFGDTSDDVHAFTGSLQQSGANSYFLGKVGIGETDLSGDIGLYVKKAAGTVIKSETTATNGNPDVLIVDADNNNARASLQVQGNGGAIESLWVSSTGNVGIGTTSPSTKLHITDTAAAFQFTADTGTAGDGRLNIGHFSNGTFIGTYGDDGGAADVLRFGTHSGDERMRIDSSGNVGIGTDSPTGKFESYISATRYFGHNVNSGDLSVLSDNNSAPVLKVQGTGTADLVNILDGAVNVFSILDGGNINAYSGLNNNTFNFGRNSSEKVTFYVDDNNITITADQDSDSDGGHGFILDRSFAGTGANYFDIRKGGSAQLRVDTDGNVGIGNTDPNVALDVSGEVAIRGGEGADDARMYFRASDKSNRFTIETDLDGTTSNDLLGFRSTDADNILVLKGNGNIGLGTTSPRGKLDVLGGIYTYNGIVSHAGTYTDGGTYTNQWQKVLEHTFSAFSFANFKLTVMEGGDTSNGNVNADVYIHYKNQNGALRITATIVNYGNRTLLADNFEIYRNNSTNKLTIYHKIPNNYTSPTYTISAGQIGNITWYGTVVGASLSGETNDSFTNKIIINGITVDADNSGNVGIGTNSPGAKLDVVGSIYADGFFQNGSVTENVVFSQGTGTAKPSVALWGPDHASYPGQVHIVANSSNASADSGKISFWDYTGTAFQRNMTIDKSGNVGIGTDSPSKKLDVRGEVALDIMPAFQQAGAIRIGRSDGTSRYHEIVAYNDSTAANNYLRFDVHNGTVGANVEVLTLQGDGNVGIGTTSPGAKLHVFDSAAVEKPMLQVMSHATAAGSFTNNYMVEFNHAFSTVNHGMLVKNNESNDARRTLDVADANGVFASFTNGKVGIGTTAPVEKLHVQGNITGSGNLTLEGNAGYPIFESGFGGSGWRVDSSANAEFQNLTVRGTFSVYELLAQQIRATNGSLLVATSGKVDGVDGTTLFFDSGSGYGHGFVAGDVLISQRLDPVGGQLERTFITVQSVANTGSLVYTDASGSPSTPQPGQEFVRIGHTSNANRQGHIYLTADDTYAPYIGVRDGLSGSAQFEGGESIEKVRVGRLDGITSSTFGSLSGYGFWAKGDAYLEGGISATFGDIGGFGITETAISSSNNNLILRDDGQITGSTVLFDGGKIGGWTINSGNLSATNITLSSDNQKIDVGSGIDINGTGDSNAGSITIGSNVTLNGSSDSSISGWTIGTNIVGGNIELDSGGTIRHTSDLWKLNNDGSGLFADNNINFDASGNFNIGEGSTGITFSSTTGKLDLGYNVTINYVKAPQDVSIYVASSNGNLTGNLGLGAASRLDDYGYTNVTTNLGASQATIEAANPDVVIFDHRNWGINAGTTSIPYQLYASGSAVLTIGNDTTNGHWMITSHTGVSGTGVWNGTLNQDLPTNHPFRVSPDTWTQSSGDSGYRITGYIDDIEVWAFHTSYPTNPLVLVQTNEKGGIFMHIQEGFIYDTDPLIVEAILGFLARTTRETAEFYPSFINQTRITSTTIEAPQIKANGGRIGNTIFGTDLSSLDATGKLFIGEWSSGRPIIRATGNSTNTAVQIDPSQTDMFFVSNSSGQKVFNVTKTSAITLAGFTVANSQLYTGTKSTFASNDAGVYVGTDGIALGTNSPFNVNSSGDLVASSATIGGSSTIAGFDITDTQISDSGTNLILKDNGEITGSQVLFTGGDIGGWSISSTDLRSTDGSVRLESDTNSIVLFDSSGNDYITFDGNGLISQDDSLPSSTQRNVIDVSRDKIYVGEYTPNDSTGASDTFVRIGTGNTGLRVANTNAVITGSLKVTDIPSPGSVTNALFVGADNQIVQETLGSLAFSSATYDNYQYWQITDGTNTTNVGSTNLISLSGGTGISTSLPVLSQTMTISLDLTEITLSSGLDSTATSLTLDLTEVGFTGGADRLITNDNDGTVTAEANLTFDGTDTLTIGEGTNTNQTSEIGFKVWDDDALSATTIILRAPSTSNTGGTLLLPNNGTGTSTLAYFASGNTNNRVLTANGTNGVVGEANLTYNGTDLTITNGNVNVSSGYGIDFAATGQAGGMTSELLDDYEEGTWTPAYKGRFGSTIYNPTAGSTSNTSATYTKIGNKVFFSCYMRSSGITFASTSYILVVDNLPFVCGEYTSVGISYADQFAGDYPAGGYVESGQDYIVLTYRNASDGDIFGMNTGDLSNGDNVNDIMLAGFYTI